MNLVSDNHLRIFVGFRKFILVLWKGGSFLFSGAGLGLAGEGTTFNLELEGETVGFESLCEGSIGFPLGDPTPRILV
jgi:hypothetical protein